MKRKYILYITFIFILLFFTAFLLNKEKSSIFEKIIMDIFNSTNKIMIGKSNVDTQSVNYIEVDSLKHEIDQLEKTLDLNNSITDFECINATVISRNTGSWYNNITIDKGIKSNIEVGDAVVSSEGLIGKVESVSNYYSKVKLMTTTDISNKISVKININSNEEYLYGLLISYDSDRNVYKIEGVSDSSDIKEKDIVSTTGLTDYFPGGIVIGYVDKVVMDEYDLNSIVEVTPSVNFDDLNYVTVLKRNDK